jgi:hypothetical protein
MTSCTKNIVAMVAALFLIAGIGTIFYSYNTITKSNTDTTAQSTTTPSAATHIEYKNAEYGFVFTLPKSWEGYTVVNGSWEGVNWETGSPQKNSGPKISIRHPQWTVEMPRQDIPISVFTPAQWDLIVSEKMGIGAAPIPPSELGRNATYVFALPARYNFAFPAGFEEVSEILQEKPLRGL